MKYQYILLIWFLFLTKKEKESYSRHRSHFEQKTIFSNLFLNSDFNNVEIIKNYLFLTAMSSVQQLTHHRRKKIFSFNPKTKEDLLYIIYIENLRDVSELTYLQRILLSRIIFKNKTKTVTFIPDIDLEKIQDPILIEVNNV